MSLNRVSRTDGDLLAAVNVNAPSDPMIEKARRRAGRIYKRDVPMIERFMPSAPPVSSNYYSLVSSSF